MIIQGDALEKLSTMPAQSVNCCITSPPYFGLRDYGVVNQIGLEPTPKEYVERLVVVFHEMRRVLRDDGTFWLNIGDSYAGYHGNKNHKIPTSSTNGWTNGTNENRRGDKRPQDIGCKQKDLIGIPWMLAFALRADGWYLRSDIIWAKPNPMPESVRDRPTRSHEHIFLLSKSAKYYYDTDAIAEPLTRPDEATRKTPGKFGGADKHVEAGKQSRLHSGNEYLGTKNGTRNKRDVWTITPQPFRGAHFAAFPEKLVEPCLLAGCPVDGIVLDPFSGAGTVGVVAAKHNRNFIGIELNPDYIVLAEKRIQPCEVPV